MKTAAGLFTFAVLLLASAARAETSAITDAFAASAARALAVLQRSDDLAFANGSAKSQAFAARDLAVQAVAGGALVAWAHAEQRAAKAAAATPTIDGLGPVFYPFDAAVLPLSIDGRAATAADRALFERLAALHGSAFDAFYAASQADALDRLQATYIDYIKNGDDTALRRLAVRNLPRVRQLLAELRRRRICVQISVRL